MSRQPSPETTKHIRQSPGKRTTHLSSLPGVMSYPVGRLMAAPIILLWLLFSPAAKAQPPIKIKIGMGWSDPQLSFPSTSSFERSAPGGGKDGMVLGLGTQVPVGGQWWFKPDVQISFKGYVERHSYALNNDVYSYKFGKSITYLELPLNFVFSSGANGTGFQAGGGPVVGYLLNPNFQQYALKQIDAGLNLQAGYQTAIGFSFHLGYEHGLLDVAYGDQSITSLKNRFLSFSVGYVF